MSGLSQYLSSVRLENEMNHVSSGVWEYAFYGLAIFRPPVTGFVTLNTPNSDGAQQGVAAWKQLFSKLLDRSNMIWHSGLLYSLCMRRLIVPPNQTSIDRRIMGVLLTS